MAGLAKRLTHIHSQKVVLGVSGGLDSTLALLVCVKTFDKLGYDRKGIIGVTMSGFGTSGRTYRNALSLMESLGITMIEISIAKAVMQHFEALREKFKNHPSKIIIFFPLLLPIGKGFLILSQNAPIDL